MGGEKETFLVSRFVTLSLHHCTVFLSDYDARRQVVSLTYAGEF